MAVKKRVRKARDLREELYHGLVLAAAEQEFAEHGFELARVQRVAEAAGLSVGTLYNLFDGKEELYLAVHKARGGELTQRIVAALGLGGAPLERIARAVEAFVKFSFEHPAYLRVQLRGGISWSSTPAHLPASALKTWKSAIGAAVAICQQGILDGYLIDEDPLRMVRTIAGIHQAHMSHWLEDGLREEPAVVSARVSEIVELLYGVAAAKKRADSPAER